jgi:hypothetical protein
VEVVGSDDRALISAVISAILAPLIIVFSQSCFI